MATIIQSSGITQLQTNEAQELLVKPALRHSNPFAAGGDGNKLVKTISGVHEYKPLHMDVPDDVLIPQTGCEVWNPSAAAYVTSDKIQCEYMEVNKTLCGDEFIAKCLHNIASKKKEITDLMVNQKNLTPITASLVLGLKAAIGSSVFKMGWFGDPNIGTSSYHSADFVDYAHRRSSDQRARFLTMMQQNEGIDTLLRRRAGNKQVAYVDTNNGTATGNATLPTNIDDFLVEMRLKSSDVLQYFDQYAPGAGMPGYWLQGGLWNAFMKYLKSLPGGSDNHRFIVDGTPVPGVYEFDGYPVVKWNDPDMFDTSMGLKGDNGHSLNQRAIFAAPNVPTLITNLNDANGITGQGLLIQESPLIREKGRTDMYMSLGVGSGIAHNELITYAFNSDTDYVTS